MADDHPFDAARLTQLLTTQRFGRPAACFERIDSTNSYLREAAAAGAPHGTLALADLQTAGRGRLGRTWEAPARSSLLFSLLLRPRWPVERLAWAAMIAGLAAVEGVEATTDLVLSLKWPNDLIAVTADGRRCKVGGILVELLHADRPQPAVIVGTGINVNIPAAELPVGRLPPASLLVLLQRLVEREALLAAILARWEAHDTAAEQGRSPFAAWRSRLIGLGEWATVSTPAGSRQGTAEGVDDSGHLLLRTADGALHTVSAGDVDLGGRSHE